MCDYSLQNLKSRAAKVGDRLTTRSFGTGTRGFSAQQDRALAVYILPGTELAFDEDIETPGFWSGRPRTHHDALEFPDGRNV